MRIDMLRTAGRAVYRQYSQIPIRLPGSSVCSRALATAGEGSTSRLVELSTKEEYVNFPRDKSVVYFTAKWCPPCRRIGPFFAELSDETPEVSFGKVDIDDNGDAAKMAGIMSVPTFKFYQEGLEVESISGADANSVEQAVAKLAES